jgi:uncharacterized protein YigA (DUF484 family)
MSCNSKLQQQQHQAKLKTLHEQQQQLKQLMQQNQQQLNQKPLYQQLYQQLQLLQQWQQQAHVKVVQQSWNMEFEKIIRIFYLGDIGLLLPLLRQ